MSNEFGKATKANLGWQNSGTHKTRKTQSHMENLEKLKITWKEATNITQHMNVSVTPEFQLQNRFSMSLPTIQRYKVTVAFLEEQHKYRSSCVCLFKKRSA